MRLRTRARDMLLQADARELFPGARDPESALEADCSSISPASPKRTIFSIISPLWTAITGTASCTAWKAMHTTPAIGSIVWARTRFFPLCTRTLRNWVTSKAVNGIRLPLSVSVKLLTRRKTTISPSVSNSPNGRYCSTTAQRPVCGRFVRIKDGGALKKIVLLVLLLIAIAGAWWAYQIKSTPPSVPFAKAMREKISNNLSTNGKVEPEEYMDVRVDVQGLVQHLGIRQGDTVTKGQAIAELSQTGLEQELQSSEARAAQARADLSTLTAGGRSADLAEIDGNIAVLRKQREEAAASVDSLDRLVKKQAATAFELKQAQNAVADLDVRIQALEKRRPVLVNQGDIESAQARIREAEASIALAKAHIAQNTIKAPMSGVVYDLPARAGAYLHPGDLLGAIGIVDPVRHSSVCR